MFKSAFWVPVGALLLAFAPAASAASASKVVDGNGGRTVSIERSLSELAKWALGLGAFGLTGALLRAQKPKNFPS